MEQRLKELEKSIDAKNEVITTLRRDLGSVKNSHARLEEIDTEMGENLLEPAEAEVEKCEEESKEKADTKLAFPESDDKPGKNLAAYQFIFVGTTILFIILVPTPISDLIHLLTGTKFSDFLLLLYFQCLGLGAVLEVGISFHYVKY